MSTIELVKFSDSKAGVNGAHYPRRVVDNCATYSPNLELEHLTKAYVKESLAAPIVDKG